MSRKLDNFDRLLSEFLQSSKPQFKQLLNKLNRK